MNDVANYFQFACELVWSPEQANYIFLTFATTVHESDCLLSLSTVSITRQLGDFCDMEAYQTNQLHNVTTNKKKHGFKVQTQDKPCKPAELYCDKYEDGFFL